MSNRFVPLGMKETQFFFGGSIPTYVADDSVSESVLVEGNTFRRCANAGLAVPRRRKDPLVDPGGFSRRAGKQHSTCGYFTCHAQECPNRESVSGSRTFRLIGSRRVELRMVFDRFF